MPGETTTYTRRAHAALDPERLLIAALLRQALADRHAADAAVRAEARAWFARGANVFWLTLVGLPDTSLDHVLKETERC